MRKNEKEMVIIRGKIIFFRITTSFILLFLILVNAIPAGAASIKEKKREAQSVKNQMDGLSRGLNKVAQQYNATLSRLANIEQEIVVAERELAEAQRELERCERNLSKRLNFRYREGNRDFADVIFGAKSFEDFLVRLDFLTKVSQADSILIKQIKLVKAEIERRKEYLASQKRQQKTVASNLKVLGSELTAKLAKQQALLSRVQGEIARLVAEERARAARARALNKVAYNSKGQRVSRSGFIRIGNLLFPVSGSFAFSNDWGAPRSGGRRHQGTDIFSLNGTPVVATVGGTVEQRSGGNAGLYTVLRGNDGNTYYYMHLSGFGAGGQVNAGDTIGYVGSSGNARGTSPHLHFEVHPGGGGAVNPYPYLSGK